MYWRVWWILAHAGGQNPSSTKLRPTVDGASFALVSPMSRGSISRVTRASVARGNLRNATRRRAVSRSIFPKASRAAQPSVRRGCTKRRPFRSAAFRLASWKLADRLSHHGDNKPDGVVKVKVPHQHVQLLSPRPRRARGDDVVAVVHVRQHLPSADAFEHLAARRRSARTASCRRTASSSAPAATPRRPCAAA